MVVYEVRINGNDVVASFKDILEAFKLAEKLSADKTTYVEVWRYVSSVASSRLLKFWN